MRVIDLPGHQRLRYRLREFLPVARAIVFVVDSMDLEIRANAEYFLHL